MKIGKIVILASAHKPTEIFKSEYLFPIEVGAANRESHFFELRDDLGENISAKNPLYCELTAQYWAWKNLDAEYYGFCHYRRFLSFGKANKAPYRFTDKRGDELKKELNVDAIERLLNDYDAVVPMAERIYKSVYSQYVESAGQRLSDLITAVDILKQKYPYLSKAADDYLNGDECYFANSFVMKKELFDAYCEIQFSVLSELEGKVTDLPMRAAGFVAERICGIYITYLKNTIPERIFYAQRVDLVYCFEDGKKRKLIYSILKPGTRLRAIVKKVLKGN